MAGDIKGTEKTESVDTLIISGITQSRVELTGAAIVGQGGTVNHVHVYAYRGGGEGGGGKGRGGRGVGGPLACFT